MILVELLVPQSFAVPPAAEPEQAGSGYARLDFLEGPRKVVQLLEDGPQEENLGKVPLYSEKDCLVAAILVVGVLVTVILAVASPVEDWLAEGDLVLDYPCDSDLGLEHDLELVVAPPAASSKHTAEPKVILEGKDSP